MSASTSSPAIWTSASPRSIARLRPATSRSTSKTESCTSAGSPAPNGHHDDRARSAHRQPTAAGRSRRHPDRRRRLDRLQRRAHARARRDTPPAAAARAPLRRAARARLQPRLRPHGPGREDRPAAARVDDAVVPAPRSARRGERPDRQRSPRAPARTAMGRRALLKLRRQALPVGVDSPEARAVSRYFGRGRGVTFYVWTSDQHTHYATRVVRTTVRDATYVLDGILDNQTELPIEKHTTDTAGYSDIIFALFDLLGLQFAPRLAGLPDRRLYRLGSAGATPAAQLLAHPLNLNVIRDGWDDLVRCAASLRTAPSPRACSSRGCRPPAASCRSRGRCRSTDGSSRRGSCSATSPRDRAPRDRPPTEQRREPARPARPHLPRQPRHRPTAHARAPIHPGALPAPRRQRDRLLEHDLHPARARRTRLRARRRRARRAHPDDLRARQRPGHLRLQQ